MTPIETKGIEEAAKSAGNLLARVIGPAADAYGLIKADNMNLRRLRNQIRNLEKVKKIVEEEGITMREVNLKAMFPLLEGIALEEDEKLEDMWAKLFTNYLDANVVMVSHVYPAILAQLSSFEVEILEKFKAKYSFKHSVSSPSTNRIRSDRYFWFEDLANLERLGLVEPIPKFKTIRHNRDGMAASSKTINEFDKPDHYKLTAFAIGFLTACERKPNE